MSSADQSQPSDVTLSLDATLELLYDHERRAILRYLIESSNNTASTTELVQHLSQKQAAETGERPPFNRIETQLYHVHMPKLTEAGILDYDARSEEVRYWHNERLERWLDRIQEEEDS